MSPVPPDVARNLNARRMDIESAINEVEGDVLLLNLAIADVFANRTEKEGEHHVYRVTTAQVRAITHADTRMFCSVRELAKTFYGREIDEP